MAGYEQTIIVGNVGRDPEMRYMPSGEGVCKFSVAVTTKWNDRETGNKREKTNWYSVNAWGKLADIANEHIRKGTPVMVVGTVEAQAYMGKDNQVKSSLELRAISFQMLGNRDDNGQSDDGKGKGDIPF